MQGLNALHLASPKGNIEWIMLLLKAGADVAGVDPVVRVDATPCPHYVPALPVTANSLRLSLCWCQQGTTPLMYACQTGRAEAAKLLLDSGADLAAADDEVMLLTYAAFGFLGSEHQDRAPSGDHGTELCKQCTLGFMNLMTTHVSFYCCKCNVGLSWRQAGTECVQLAVTSTTLPRSQHLEKFCIDVGRLCRC